ncbi:iron-sulfur cluster-binding protein [Pseudomonas sp. MAHUQ-62]|uniref:iron-sulfur cluster-binding protein n=1 Tax=Pseudomonas sp. GCM10023245 TaxID=3252652 RepID=UPI00361D9B5A
MKIPAPRTLWLSGSQSDGEGARVFDFVIEQPMDCDRDVIPGQFFMLSVPGLGEAPFSYLDLPDVAGNFQALIHRRGILTSALFAQAPGAILGYRGPYGKGWPLLIGRHKVLAVAADCGLIHLTTFIKEARDWHLPVNLNLLHVTDGHQSRTLSAAQEGWKEYFQVMATSGEDVSALRLHGAPLLQMGRVLDSERPDTVLCAGPEAFMRTLARMCTTKGIQPNNIWLFVERRMPCGIGLCGHCHFGTSHVCVDGPVYRYDHYRHQIEICEPHASSGGYWYS